METEPEIRVGARNRKPDFRVMVTGQPWTYVEVTNPNESGAQRDVLRGIEQLTSLLEECTGSFALEVFLKREPTAAELGELQDVAPNRAAHVGRRFEPNRPGTGRRTGRRARERQVFADQIVTRLAE